MKLAIKNLFHTYRKKLRTKCETPVFLIFLFSLTLNAYALSDQVTHLPGLRTLQNKQYAGYAQLGHHQKVFYWFVQANKKNAPLILWSNGGPGYSSLYGFFNETGPYKITKALTLTTRKNAWNNFANYLIIDQPDGVGLSKTNKVVYEKSRVDVINAYYDALEWFLAHHPAYQNSPIYLAGESYAGTYLPLLAKKILAENKIASHKIHLQGLILISPWADPIAQQSMDSRYALSHGFITATQKQKIDLIYQHCAQLIHQKQYKKANGICGNISDSIGKIANLPDLANIAYTSLDTNTRLDKYINQPAVLSAIHASHVKKFKCFSNTVNNYFTNDIQRSVTSSYDYLLNHHIPILIFSGLNDMKDTNFLGQQVFLHDLAWTKSHPFFQQPIKSIVIKNYMGDLTLGYSQSYQALTWIKVLNAGHMVPRDQPRIALLVKEFNRKSSPQL